MNLRHESAYSPSIIFSLQQGDITSFDADVVALKHAQEFWGADKLIASYLIGKGVSIAELSPQIGDYRYLATKGVIQAHHVLFIGVPELGRFSYSDVQRLSFKALDILAHKEPNTKHIAMTIHGIGFGLDEVEVIQSQLAGYVEAIEAGRFPAALTHITIVERNPDRVRRLRQALDTVLSQSDYAIKMRPQAASSWSYALRVPRTNETYREAQSFDISGLRGAGKTSDAKAHAFVAMPFAKEMDDVFYYGIQQPTRAAGFLCERIDQQAFTGDILARVKEKIETAAVVIAELSGANPNVYLEVGYAWGKGRPTILLAKNEAELRFDVSGQHCLKYERIKDLEDLLTKELEDLKKDGIIVQGF